MKRMAIQFFQILIVLISLIVLLMLLFLPMNEGRAKNLDLFHNYADPFILFCYLTSIAFFAAMYHAFKLLGYYQQNEWCAGKTIQALRSLRYISIVGIVLIVAAGTYIKFNHAEEDDPAGFLAICFVTTLLSIAVVIIAVKLENKLLNTLDRLS